MAGCKTCCDDVPQQHLIERVLKSLIRQMLLSGELAPGLQSCEGTLVAKNTKVPSCTDVTQMIQQAIRDAAGGNGPQDIRGQIIDVINGLILDGTLSPGLQTCDGAALGKGAKIATCADLDCAQFRCGGGNNGGGNNGGGNNGGGNNGGGTDPVDKYLTNVIIDEAAKTMTFKVKDQPDIVVDVTKFLEDLNDFVTNAIVDNAAKTVTLKVKNQADVVINLEEMLQGLGGSDTYHTVKQPTFDNDTRVLTIPQERFINGASQGVDNWQITIPATGNAPGGADNDTTVSKLELVESNGTDGKEYKVKLTDSAGGTVETATAIVVPNKGPSTVTPPGGGQQPKPVYYFHESAYRANAASDTIPPNHKFDKATSVREDVFYNSEGTSKTVTKLVANPAYFTFGSDGSAAGLTSAYVNRNFYDLATGTEHSDRVNISYAKLETPTVTPDGQLTLKIAHYLGPNKINNSDQSVSVQLPAPKAGVVTQAPAHTDDTKLPLKLYGKDRTALLAEPDAWEEVVGNDGNTYVRPLYRKV